MFLSRRSRRTSALRHAGDRPRGLARDGTQTNLSALLVDYGAGDAGLARGRRHRQHHAEDLRLLGRVERRRQRVLRRGHQARADQVTRGASRAASWTPRTATRCRRRRTPVTIGQKYRFKFADAADTSTSSRPATRSGSSCVANYTQFGSVAGTDKARRHARHQRARCSLPIVGGYRGGGAPARSRRHRGARAAARCPPTSRSTRRAPTGGPSTTRRRPHRQRGPDPAVTCTPPRARSSRSARPRSPAPRPTPTATRRRGTFNVVVTSSTTVDGDVGGTVPGDAVADARQRRRRSARSRRASRRTTWRR